ncbi:hypothetical protein [Dehalobacter sp. DCM]
MLVVCENKDCEYNNLGYCNTDKIKIDKNGNCRTAEDGKIIR